MFAKARHDKIYEIIKQRGAVSVSALTQIFNVSIETVRRDLLLLEERGMLCRVHGGAVSVSGMKPLAPLSTRNELFADRKCELSRYAMHFINEGDFIAVDSGSTAIYFAEELKAHFSALTVVTHSADVFDILRNHADFSVILCGGHYMRQENSFFGTLTLDAISLLHMQKAFIFPSAVSAKSGIYDYTSELLLVQRKLIECSDRVFILADSSKYECMAPLRLCESKSEFCYITDSALPPETAELYKENGLEVIQSHYSGLK